MCADRAEKMAGPNASDWSDAFDALCRELRADRGRPGFIDGSDPTSSLLIERISLQVSSVVSLGSRLAEQHEPPSVSNLVADLGAPSTLLVDIDVLFTPALHIEVLSQLRRTAQNTALIVAWPGRIAGGRLSYSLPGRADRVDEPARDTVVLRPVETHFPDEVPYSVERYPA